MIELASQLDGHGIRLQDFRQGEHKALCPQCSHTRKHKADKCLSLKIDDQGGATWNCKNNGCDFRGNIPSRSRDFAPRPAPRPVVKPKPTGGSLPAEVIQWFAGRGISEATLARHKIQYGPAWIPDKGKVVPCIHFPYYRAGELVNIKYRTLDKKFGQTKDAEKCLYGLDDIAGQETIIIVEGEMDKLALAEIGFDNAVSGPDGAQEHKGDTEIIPEDAKAFAFLWNCKDELAGAEKIILAGDNDRAGRPFMDEIARRLGKERCWRVTWPTVNDAPRKDANEVLMSDGRDVLRECIEAARPYPIKSLYDLDAFEAEVLSLYRDGPARAFSTGWSNLDAYMKIRPGELSIVTGIPSSGKSEFVDALMMNLATQYDWRFAICSFENPPAEHIAKLAEKYLAMPFWEGPTPRMGEGDLQRARKWLRERFVLIRADDEAPTIDWIIETAKAAVLRYGVKGLVIDPYNEIEHRRPSNMSETEYVSEILGKLRRLAETHGIHIWFVAHPTKQRRGDDGKIPVPTLYDISGSANWNNKADLGVVVHRDWDGDTNRVEIWVRKVRFKAVGDVGMADLYYDRPTGRYSETLIPKSGFPET